MTQPALAHATDYGRMYSRSTSSAPEVPSITTVIGQEAKDLTGWASHMATQELIHHDQLPLAVGNANQLKKLARQATDAASRFRDAAAARGDRVHFYAEQVGLEQLGLAHVKDAALASLDAHQELAFARTFDHWWNVYGVEAVATEITVWNKTVGYAGTLDLVARIGGRLCLIDFKTKGLDRQGRAKPLSDSVVMQLVAGMQAQEKLSDADSGTWEAWSPREENPILLAIAISETEVVPMQAKPDSLQAHWHKFWALRQVWEHSRTVDSLGAPLASIAPPAQ